MQLIMVKALSSSVLLAEFNAVFKMDTSSVATFYFALPFAGYCWSTVDFDQYHRLHVGSFRII